ncbi:MAG: cupin domain-containing protein [Roseovarius sp.]
MPNDIFRISPDPVGEIEPSDMIPKESFTTDDQTEWNKTFYQTPDGSILAGIWECAPCRLEFEEYPVDEKMTVISGSVTLTQADGTAEVFNAGDVLFVSKGSKFNWHITETLRKYYMIAT